MKAAADRLAGLSTADHEELLTRTDREFAAAEGQPDVPAAYRFDGPPHDAVRGAASSPVTPAVDASLEMTRDQVRSLLPAHAVASRVVTDPEGTRALARSNLHRMRAATAPGGAIWLDAWEPQSGSAGRGDEFRPGLGSNLPTTTTPSA